MDSNNQTAMQEAIALIKQKMQDEITFWEKEVEYCTAYPSDGPKGGYRKEAKFNGMDAFSLNMDLSKLIEGFKGDNPRNLLALIDAFINSGELRYGERVIEKSNIWIRHLRQLPEFSCGCDADE